MGTSRGNNLGQTLPAWCEAAKGLQLTQGALLQINISNRTWSCRNGHRAPLLQVPWM